MNSPDYWDSLAGKKKFTIPFRLETLKRHIKTANASVLDFGCGYGRTLHELKDGLNPRLYGCDCSKEMIKLASAELPEAVLRVNKNLQIPFPDKSFDALVLLAVLTCIPSDADQKNLVSEIKRVLKKGGILYLGDFLLNSDERNKARYENYLHKNPASSYGTFSLDDGAVLRHHLKSWLDELFSNFTRLEYSEETFRTMNGHSSNGFYAVFENT